MKSRSSIPASIVILLPLWASGPGVEPKFYPDDPLHAEPPPRHVERVLGRKFSDYYDFFYSSFGNPTGADRKAPPPRAQAVNTIDEAMDSAWWQRRHYYRRMSMEELLDGPGGRRPPAATGKWRVVKAKSEGITPGFTIEDETGQEYYLKFDPPEHPEMATAPDVLVARLFYGLGFNVPDNYIVEFDLERLVVEPGTKLKDNLGQAREMTSRDVTEIMINVPRTSRGLYRAVASLTISGKWAGPYRYWGTRSDDPNDTVPHEHRRDLRGLSVACAWVNHDDSRSVNTIDFLVNEGGRQFVKHYLIDFGSTLGSGTQKANSPRSGFEYLWELKPALAQFFTFGLMVPDWAKARYPDLPSVGLLEYEKFDALSWKPEYPNPAFSNRLPDDGFWMAKQVMAFTDEEIRAIVRTGQYSDPAAEDWVAECLIKRRDKIGRAFFGEVLPLDQFAVRGGRLVFENLAVKHGFTAEPAYSVQWSVFDNNTRSSELLNGANGFEVPARPAEFLLARIHGGDAAKRVDVYLRLRGNQREVVGVERTW
ncbi:MAG: hypothetical protein KJZ84_05910 [Bryobacteraceae bacterium]|nr:hypothetical protein [Bryobacteraceae bacterium]